MITAEQLTQLKTLVAKLSDDNDSAGQKTQASNQADTDAAAATAHAAQAKLDEAAADATVAGDLTDLTHFVEGLGSPPAPLPTS